MTLKQIADATGASIRTVNRALKEQSGISSWRRADILAVAAELGYTPNIAARNLRLKRSNFVGIIGGGSVDSVFTRKIIGLQRRLAEDGYYPVMGLLPETAAAMRAMLLEWAGFVSTVVFFAWHDWKSEGVLDNLPQQFIFVDRTVADAPGSYLPVDRSTGIFEGVCCLRDCGRKKIARCGSIPSREIGWNKAFDSFGSGQVGRVFIATKNSEFADGYACGQRLTDAGVDAVFFDTDRMAFGFLKYAWENNLKAPEDIAVIGFDDDPWGVQSCPALSTVAHPITEMNEKIVELVASEQTGNFTFKTKFIRRESV